MRQENWIPTVGEWISVPNPLTQKRTAMRVTKRVKKNGQKLVQCGDHLFSLEICQQWEPARIECEGFSVVQDPNLWQFLNDLWDRGGANMAKHDRQIKQDWVSTQALAQELSVSTDFLLKNKNKLFEAGTHWKILNPLAGRPTYRWNKPKVMETLTP